MIEHMLEAEVMSAIAAVRRKEKDEMIQER